MRRPARDDAMDASATTLGQGPRTDEAPGFVGDYLLYLLAAASDAASEQFHETIRAEGLRVPEWRVLACLSDRDGSMITRLARLALIEQSRLTRIIVQMELRGLVSRRSDPRDGRRVRVYMTETGRDIALRLVARAREHEAGLLERLDMKELKPVLRALIETLDEDPRTDL